ncbi:unnamed protein product [Symbiodinium sp. CCMP2456]|nr:unnamed protein product [Symbiodinium sp. CCMP2456]
MVLEALHVEAADLRAKSEKSSQSPLQVRGHLHSASLQKFFTNKTHKKYCENCGKPSALLLERCSYCGEALSDSQIAAMARDPLLEAVLDAGSSDFDELHRSFELLVLKHRYPVGREHLLVMPKDTCYDLRQLRRRQVPFLKKMYQKAMECLRTLCMLPEGAPDPPVACGFSYPADYNHLHLHVVAAPFTRLELFARPVFYPLAEVEVQLQKKGIVRPHPALDLAGEEAQSQWIARLDSQGRQE